LLAPKAICHHVCGGVFLVEDLKKSTGDMARVVEPLPGNHKAFGFEPQYHQKKFFFKKVN
jgi:hypothetical protein